MVKTDRPARAAEVSRTHPHPAAPNVFPLQARPSPACEAHISERAAAEAERSSTASDVRRRAPARTPGPLERPSPARATCSAPRAASFAARIQTIAACCTAERMLGICEACGPAGHARARRQRNRGHRDPLRFSRRRPTGYPSAGRITRHRLVGARCPSTRAVAASPRPSGGRSGARHTTCRYVSGSPG